jgi:hypothetical protein
VGDAEIVLHIGASGRAIACPWSFCIFASDLSRGIARKSTLWEVALPSPEGADHVPHLLLDTGGACEPAAPFWERVILRTEVTHPLLPRCLAEDMGND